LPVFGDRTRCRRLSQHNRPKAAATLCPDFEESIADREETWFDEKDVELTFRKFQKLLTDWLKKRGYLKLQ
jgi:hypothetical protein